MNDLPYLVYLEGGPGVGNPEPQDSALTAIFLNRGYQVLFLDYRGTGLSTPVNARWLAAQGEPKHQANYLKLFRADNIVRDCEAVRKYLTADLPEEKKQWSLFGQSFGGFVSLTYLSKHPHYLREVFITGGLAPVLRTAEEVYRATCQKTIERSGAYYRKFPEDIGKVGLIFNYLQAAERDGKAIRLPDGGLLTAQRFLTLGMSFGCHGGFDLVHSIVLKMNADLDQFGFLTRATLINLEKHNAFDANPIYAILHEAIYCSREGMASDWAAFRIASEFKAFGWTHVKDIKMEAGVPIYFSGEMIFPFLFETYPELQEMRDAADILATFDGWDDLYDLDQLGRNDVPVYAASFIDDMYVDINFARETANLIRGARTHETNSMYHNAIRVRTGEALSHLFRLRDDTLD